jgi:hypothetical protein
MLFLAKLLSYNLASLNSNIALSSVAALLKKTLVSVVDPDLADLIFCFRKHRKRSSTNTRYISWVTLRNEVCTRRATTIKNLLSPLVNLR